MLADWICFTIVTGFYEPRPVPNAMATQLAVAMDVKRESTQDGEPIQRRCNSVWWKGRDDMDFSKKGVNEAATAFLMDGALAFLPLTFSKLSWWSYLPVTKKADSLYDSPPILVGCSGSLFSRILLTFPHSAGHDQMASERTNNRSRNVWPYLQYWKIMG